MLKEQQAAAQQIVLVEAETQPIKCVVWDLDNTIWEGVLLEDDTVILRKGVLEIVQELDRRGILNSIASRNEYDVAIEKLGAFGLKEYFLFPEINWNPKSASLETIAESLNIDLDTFAFIDDQLFEREEVASVHPEVMCIDAAGISNLLELPRMMPRFITPESRFRRQMYQSDIKRRKVESEFAGPNEKFLASLGMILQVKLATESDLQRAEELTMRTHQLNTTGYTYSYDELNALRQSDDQLLLVARLEDKYGPYGTIGLALVELGEVFWTIKLLLVSCRVMSRGIGTIMLCSILSRAQEADVYARAEFIPTDRNRMMYITYKFAGFQEVERVDDMVILESDLTKIQSYPDYVKVQTML